MADERVSFDYVLNDLMSSEFVKATKVSENSVEHLQKEIKELGRDTSEVGKRAKRTGSMFNDLRSTALRFAGGLALGAGIKSIADMGIEMEQTRVSFETMLGSVDKANTLIAEMNQFANVTPFDNKQVIDSSGVLLTANVRAEDMKDTLKAIGDVAAGTKNRLPELAAIYAKAMNKGKLQAEELNQLSERRIPILQTIADMYGITTQKVLEMGSKGELTGDVMNEAFQKMSSEGGTFFNMMEKQSQTTGGKISTLIGKLQTIGIALGEALLPAISWITDLGIALVSNMPLLETLGETIGVVTIAWMAYNIQQQIATAGTVLYTIKSAIMAAANLGLAGTFRAIGIAIMNIPIIGWVAAAITGIIALWNHVTGFRATIKGIFNVVAETFPIFKAFGEVIMGLVTFNPATIAKGVGNIVEAYKSADFAGAFNEAYDAEFAKEKKKDDLSSVTSGFQPDKGNNVASALASIKKGSTSKADTASNISKSSMSLSGSSSGGKSITINMNAIVDKLVVQSDNMKMGAIEIRRIVEKELTKSVRDFEIQAG